MWVRGDGGGLKGVEARLRVGKKSAPMNRWR